MKYAFIAEHAAHYPVERQCQVLGVSVSGYYAWRTRQPSQRQQQDQQLLADIRAVYQGSRCLYGSPRVHAALRRADIRCSRKRVARLMRQAHLRSLRQRGRRVPTTDSRHSSPPAAHLLQRDFKAQSPNQKWVADITYVPTDQGWLYLAVVLDLFARQVVGWAMSHRRDAALVQSALQMALTRRQPDQPLLHHSDQGSQYAADGYRALLLRYGIIASMSRSGNCYDNAVMESFFRTLKSECVDLHHYRTRQQAQHSLFEFMEVYYNRQRLHSSLGYRSPVEFEALHPL
jgi:putative transposase